jgi:hypothetical protein
MGGMLADNVFLVKCPEILYNWVTVNSLPIAQLNLHIPITPLLIFALLMLLLAGWGVFTVIIRYHWKNYGTGKLEVFTMNFLYLVGSGILIALLTISALLYYSSAA